MRTPLCQQLNIDLPIFAFTHCRDVVAAVSRAGGFGVLGAAYFTAEELKEALDWIDAHVGDASYGVDIILPQHEPTPSGDAQQLKAELLAQIPDGYFQFVERLMDAHGVPPWPDPDDEIRLLGWTAATVMPLLEESLRHPKCRLIANALGVPPKHLIDEIHASGRLVAGLVVPRRAG